VIEDGRGWRFDGGGHDGQEAQADRLLLKIKRISCFDIIDVLSVFCRRIVVNAAWRAV
jgi:hypothetical protein